MAKDYTVGIAGLGAIGLHLARALDAGVPGLRLAAVSAKDRKKAEANISGFRAKPLILPLARYASKVVAVPAHVIVPLIMGLTVVGAFADREYLFDMGLALAFGVIGYIAVKTNYHVTSILIGVLLGPIFERYLLRSLRIGQGDIMVLFSSPIANVLWALLVISVVLPLWRERRLARRAAAQA